MSEVTIVFWIIAAISGGSVGTIAYTVAYHKGWMEGFKEGSK